jgi:hypothetical protein
MKNYIDTGNAIAFFYNGNTFEMNLSRTWVSVKTCVDPNLTVAIEKRGIVKSEEELRLLAIEIFEKLVHKVKL